MNWEALESHCRDLKLFLPNSPLDGSIENRKFLSFLSVSLHNDKVYLSLERSHKIAVLLFPSPIISIWRPKTEVRLRTIYFYMFMTQIFTKHKAISILRPVLITHKIKNIFPQLLPTTYRHLLLLLTQTATRVTRVNWKTFFIVVLSKPSILGACRIW